MAHGTRDGRPMTWYTELFMHVLFYYVFTTKLGALNIIDILFIRRDCDATSRLKLLSGNCSIT